MAARRWDDPEPSRFQRTQVRYARPAQVVLTLLAAICLALTVDAVLADDLGRAGFYALLTLVLVLNIRLRRQTVERIRRYDAEHGDGPGPDVPGG